MTHRLQHNGNHYRSHSGGVVRGKEDLEPQPHQEYSGHHKQEARPPVPENAPKHDEREREGKSKVENPKQSQNRSAAARVPLAVAVHFLASVEIAQLLVVIHGLGPGRPPEEIGRDSIGLAIHLVRHAEGAAGDAPEVVAHSHTRHGEQEEEREHNAPERRAKREASLLEQPQKHRAGDGQAEDEPFVGPGVGENREPERDQDDVAQPLPSPDPGQRAEEQGAAGCNRRPPQVGVHPVVMNPKLQDGQEASKQRAGRRQPALQHPADGRAHHPDA